MLTTVKLLEAARTANHLPSNYALTRLLGVTDKTMNRWTTGKGTPDNINAIRLAAMAGLDPAEVLAALAVERAETPETRKVLETIAKRSRAAMVAMMAVILSLFISGGPNGGAMAAEVNALPYHASSAAPLRIM